MDAALASRTRTQCGSGVSQNNLGRWRDASTASEPPCELAIFDLLARRVGDINVRDEFGYTPLHKADQSGAVAMVEHILETYPDVSVNSRNANGDTPWDVAVSEHIGTVTPEEQAAVVELLREHGAKRGREIRNSAGETPAT